MESLSVRVLDLGRSEQVNTCALTRNVAERLGVRLGDPIQIKGRKKSVAVLGGLVEGSNELIFVDGLTRLNAGVSIDDQAVISTPDEITAEKVVLEPLNETEIVDLDSERSKEFLMGRFVSEGDIVEMPIRLLKRQRVLIAQLKPNKIVQITGETNLIVNKKKGVKRTSSVTYNDIGGLDETIEKIREIVELPLKNPKIFDKLGVDPPKGVLLHGPPGTGKTLLAKAVANESSAYYCGESASSIAGGNYGEGSKRLKELFTEALENAPSIIFLDEVDGIAPKREESFNPEDRKLITTLLTLMDGLEQRGEVIVIAATNRPNSLDLALRRPGRFDREIEITLPNEKARFEIIEVHTKRMPLSEDFDLTKLAEITNGYSGADLKNLTEEAALCCIRRFKHLFRPDGTLPENVTEKLEIAMDDFLDAKKNIIPSAGRELIVEVPKVQLSDIGGLEAVKREITKDVIVPFTHREEARKFGVSITKGILLHGKPGVGKTYLSKAIATEVGGKCIVLRASSLLSKWFGEFEQNIRKVFETARKAAPCIIIIDEIDSILSRRVGGGEGSRAASSGVNEFLSQLDGFEDISGVLVIGTTNRPDLLDDAAIRAGRLEKHFEIPLPDKGARKEIFRIHTAGIPLGEDVNFDELAEVEGLTGADIKAIVDDATRSAFLDYIDNGNEMIVRRDHFKRAARG